MNLLIHDEQRSITRVTRSLLLGMGDRVSLSEDSTDARRKIETLLFDAVLLGPSGASQELADFLDRECPTLPLLLLGVEVAIPAEGRIHAVVPKPFSPVRFHRAIETLRQKIQRADAQHEWSVQLFAGGDRVLCRGIKLERSALLVESAEGLPDDFSRFFSLHGQDPIDASLRQGEKEQRITGEVAFSEWTLGKSARMVGLRFASALIG